MKECGHGCSYIVSNGFRFNVSVDNRLTPHTAAYGRCGCHLTLP
jgi:hypothetical protein